MILPLGVNLEDNERIDMKAEEFPPPWAEAESWGEETEYSSCLHIAVVITISHKCLKRKRQCLEKLLPPQTEIYQVQNCDFLKKLIKIAMMSKIITGQKYARNKVSLVLLGHPVAKPGLKNGA